MPNARVAERENTLMRELISSVGIELEFMAIDREDQKFVVDLYKQLPRFKTVHDASSETPVLSLGDFPITFRKQEDRRIINSVLHRYTIGGEIVSPIIQSSSPDWVQDVYKLCKLLQDHGETGETDRASLNIHVNITKDVPLIVLKNILTLIAHFEAMLFRLGGMGSTNRGVHNNFIYQRPFLGNGPPYVKVRSAAYPIFVFQDLMDATDKMEFFIKYGDVYNHAIRGTRYVTQRYMCINFYSILTQ